MEYINSKAERFFGERYFKEYMASKVGFDWRSLKKHYSPYFEENGFRVSLMSAGYFSSMNGISSDRYLSPDMYFMYVIPALNRMEFKKAYSDKSFYPVLFKGERQPEIVISYASGRFYGSGRDPLTRNDALEVCLRESGQLIVKPSIETGEGRGVDLVNSDDRVAIEEVLDSHAGDPGYVVQRFIRQHGDLARINPTSLNTMRLYTYRRPNGEIVNLERQNFLRFGAKGAWKDNVARGGGFCHVRPDGMLEATMFTKGILGRIPFVDHMGFEPFKIPSFDKAIALIKRLHGQLQYFDSIGWDVAIAADGEPCLVEFNVDANLHAAQVIGGPMYGDYIDEVMERVKRVRKIKVECEVNVFDYGYDRFTQIGGPEYDVL